MAETEPSSKETLLGGEEKNSHSLLTSCEWVGLPAMLTAEHLHYEDVLALSSVEKLVAVKNLSAEYRVIFSWHCSYAADNSVYGQFLVRPSQGVIECGGTSMCKLTFMAGIQPQLFETTLYCRIEELIPEHGSDGDDSIATQENHSDYDEEVFAQQWVRLGSTIKERDVKEHQEYAVSSSTCSTNQKLPRLSAKGPLRFPSCASVKPLTEDVQGTRSEQVKKNKGTLYLTVSGSIYSGDHPQKKPEMFEVPHATVDETEAKRLDEQLLSEILGEAMREAADSQVVESRLRATKATFFEQNASLQLRDGNSMDMIHPSSQSMETNIVCASFSDKSTTGKGVSPLESSVGAFELAKVMLEFMLFDVIKEFHDSNGDIILSDH